MILNTGSRTDIPAFYSEWFYHRIEEGFVLVRNPYNPMQVTRYQLSPDVIDAMVFCTKNPSPMFQNLELLTPFKTFWFVTITPYGKEIEPHVPDKEQVLENFLWLSRQVGPESISWRYDPIFLTETYTVPFHIQAFRHMAKYLRGSTSQCVVSFLDLYAKTKRNFPEARAVTPKEQEILIDAFSSIARENSLQIHLCCENPALVRANVDADGCLSQKVLEQAIGCKLRVPKTKAARKGCPCLLNADIGAYNTCGHGCLYCYANYDKETVRSNRAEHDSRSPLLIGHLRKDDIVKDAKQTSWRDDQISLFDS